MANKSNNASQIISTPQGGGALHGVGETFAPDLHTGTGNFTVPIAMPAGRNGFQPQLSLIYSSGNGNGPYGLGWNLTVPGMSRKTSKGIHRYRNDYGSGYGGDTFILSGAEDLIPVAETAGGVRYRPRTEGLLARIEHHATSETDHWEVRSKDGLVSVYGTPFNLPDDLLPAQVTDAAGLTTTAEYDYRVLQPRMVTDANGNRRAVTFSPLGLVTATAVIGKEGEQAGDTLEAPGNRMEYDFLAFVNRRQPVFIRSIVREHHVMETDVPLPKRDETIETVEYSDGFGRLLQTRTQAEDVLFGDPIFVGQKATLFYDSHGQVIRTLNPDGSEQRVIYGIPADLTNPDEFAPTPWEAFTYDANDLAPLCEGPDGASLANAAPATHHFTPSSIVIDALGRTIEANARSRTHRVRRQGPARAYRIRQRRHGPR